MLRLCYKEPSKLFLCSSTNQLAASLQLSNIMVYTEFDRVDLLNFLFNFLVGALLTFVTFDIVPISSVVVILESGRVAPCVWAWVQIRSPVSRELILWRAHTIGFINMHAPRSIQIADESPYLRQGASGAHSSYRVIMPSTLVVQFVVSILHGTRHDFYLVMSNLRVQHIIILFICDTCDMFERMLIGGFNTVAYVSTYPVLCLVNLFKDKNFANTFLFIQFWSLVFSQQQQNNLSVQF